MSGRLSRKRRAPLTPEASPAALDITDDFSDEPVTFRAPKKTRTDARDHCSKASSKSLCKSSRRKTSTKSIPALEANVTDNENGSMEENSSTNNTKKQKEVLVLTLDDDDDYGEKQEDESDNESPFPTRNSPERARSSSSSRFKARKALDAAASAQIQGKSSSLGSTSAGKSSSLQSTSTATTSSYFSAAAAGPKINLSNRYPSKFHKGGSQGASYTLPDKRIDKTNNQPVPSLDNHKEPQARNPKASNILTLNAAGTKDLPSAANTKDQHNVVCSEDELNKVAGNKTLPTKIVNFKKKLADATDKVVVQVVDSDRDDYPCLAPSGRQRRLVAPVPDDKEEEEYNLDTLRVDPFLTELEKSVCSEHERLCPCCKHIVPAIRYGTHLRLCFGKYQYSIRGSCEEEASEGRRRGRSATVNQIKKSAAEENLSTQDGEVERVECQSLALADGTDDFKEQGNENKVGSSTNDVRRKVKSRNGWTKSRSRLDCQEEKDQKHEPKRGRQPTTDDQTHDRKTVEGLHEANKPDKMNVRQERLFGDRQPLSAGSGVVSSHQPLLSVAAGVLQVMQKSESAASVLDPADALMTEPSCMVRIKRGRDLVSAASGAPPPGPGVSRVRRGRGKKGLPVTSLVSTEQRSLALAERLAAVLLSGKPSEAEPWESVTRGRTTALGVRLSGAVTRAISADQPLWQLCRSDRGDIQQYYVPELAPHVVPPVRGDSLNITMHRHLSQIPGRLNITQSLGLPVGAFSDDEEEEPYGQEDRSSSVLYGSLGTTQLALVRLLGSQADEILNWSIRSSFHSGGECKLQDNQACQKKLTVESRDPTDEDNNRNDKDGGCCGDVVESDTLHRSDRSGEEIEGRGSDCLTNQCGNVSKLCDEAESGSDTMTNQDEIHSHMSGNNPISCNDVSSLTAVNSSPKCAVTSKRGFSTNTLCNKRSIPDKDDVGLWPETGVNILVAGAMQDVAGRDDLPPMNENGDGKADLMNATPVVKNACREQRSVISATRNVGSSGRVTYTRDDRQGNGITADDKTERVLPLDASSVIKEVVLRMTQMQHPSEGVECIKTTQVNIPAIEAVDFLQLQVPTDVMKSKEQEKQPSNKGGSDCSEDRDDKGECITEQEVDGEPDGLVWQDGASANSYRSRDEAASDVTILFDASSDADVIGRQEDSNGSIGIVSREILERRMDVIEASGRIETKVGGAKEGSLAKTIVFDSHENVSKTGNPSDDNLQSSTIPYSCDEHSPSGASPDLILLDDGSSTKSLSPKKNSSVDRENVSHEQQPTDCLPSAKVTPSSIIGQDNSRMIDMFGHGSGTGLNGGAITRADEIGEPSQLFENVLRHCTTIPASDYSSSDDGTDQMFSKTKPSDNIKRVTCNKRTLSNLSIKNLSRFNSLQAASSSNLNPISQSSDFMLERYLTTLVRDASAPAVPTSPSGEGRERSRSSRVEAVAERSSSMQKVMLTSMAAAWKGLFESGDGGDVTVYTKESSFAVHAFVLNVRCPIILNETHGRVQSDSTEGRISGDDISDETRSLLWKNISHEASHNFFTYIYSGCCDWKLNEPAVVLEVLSLARKYGREDLVQFCQVTAALRKPGHQTENSLVQTREGDSEKDTRLIVPCDDELEKSSSFRRHTTPINVTPVTTDESKDRAVRINDTRRSLIFSPSSRADQDISLPSLDFGGKITLGPTEKSNIGPGLPPDQQTTNISLSRASHQDAGCFVSTVDKVPKTHVPTPIDISKLLEGKLCGMVCSDTQPPCTNRSHDKQSMHYKSLATVRSLSPDLFSDGDEEPFDQSVYSQERNRNCVDQSLISEKKKLHHSGHSSQSKILQNPSNKSAASNKISPERDVQLRLSSVDTSNLTIEDEPGNDNIEQTKGSIDVHDALGLCHISLENNPKALSKPDDQNVVGKMDKMNIISASVVHGEDDIIDISQSDSDASRENSNTTLASVNKPTNALAPLSPSKIGANLPCGKYSAKGCSTSAELYNKTTDAESEAGQTSGAYVSNVWDDFEDMGYCHDDGGPLTSEKTSCDRENQTESCENSDHLRLQTNVPDNRPKLCEGRCYGLNSTVVEADKNKILNLSSVCQNISRISIGEAALQRQSECFRAVTIRHKALDTYASAKAGHSSMKSHPDTGNLHCNSLVRKMFSNDSLMQLQEELQKEWDAEELELSTGFDDTSLRSRLSNKRKRVDDFCVQQSPKRKRKCRTPSKRKVDDTRHPLPSKSLRPEINNLITNKNILRNNTKRPRDVSSSKVPSNEDVENQLSDVASSPAVRNAASGVGALPHRVQQLQGRRDSITSPSTASFSPNCSAADSSLAITPKPDFSTMPTPDLKRRLQQFGIRPLSRNKARALLQHIYEQTHPVVSSSRPSCAGGSNRLQSPVGGIGSCQSGPSVSALRASTPAGRSRAGAARRATGKKTRAWTPRRTVAVAATAATAWSVQRVTPREKSGCPILEESDGEERLMTHKAHATYNSSTTTAELVDLSQSDGEEDSSLGCAEESMLLQLPEENPPTATDIESVHEQLRALIVSDSSLHRAVLLYQPLWLHHFKDAASNAGIRCTASALIDFLDQQCITFRMGSSTRTGRIRTRQKKPRKKRGGVA